MADYSWWFVAALLLAGAEMATGTFYMLVVALAMALGGIAALAGFDMVWQYALSGIAAVIGTVVLYRIRAARPDAAQEDNSLDTGQPVKLIRWNDDGTARVHYRGAEWDAELESSDTPRESTLYIKAMLGNKLILTSHKL
ncbi:MAG: NfeD family protein [Nitrosomonadales bacterium]|nr:NfeD family protein [Nitrosomonadales bacterium]